MLLNNLLGFSKSAGKSFFRETDASLCDLNVMVIHEKHKLGMDVAWFYDSVTGTKKHNLTGNKRKYPTLLTEYFTCFEDLFQD